MAYYWVKPELGLQAITDTLTTQKHPLGHTARAFDPTTYGEGEFIYLQGLASTAIGDVVIYDLKAGTTTRGVAGSRGPVAVAMSANVASQYGWYQVVGSAVLNETGATAGANCYWTATAGVPSATTVAGDKIDGIRFKGADGTPAAGQAVAQISWPSANANG